MANNRRLAFPSAHAMLRRVHRCRSCPPGFVLLAANRDERLDRAWDPPDAWWPDRPGVVAGRDRTAGGTWMGMNRFGVVAAVLNRPGTLGPVAGKRSRGELPLMALDHPTAAGAAAAIVALDAGAWRGFNMVLADRTGAIFIRGLGHGRPGRGAATGRVDDHRTRPERPGQPAHGASSAAIRGGRTRGPDDWHAWLPILADRRGGSAEQINVEPRGGFGTVCSSFVSLPVAGPPIWRFAAGPPHKARFRAGLLPVGCGCYTRPHVMNRNHAPA